ncbi:MarR family winged helix-turn-helix transcriptional regulator [Paenibacillus sp. OSY-SE]|uniref:MarR family winged helix-turn-helix transcriptional regulator n=1 Tax=Paenibacillus sp. OSY-SE TaxID=1196323 RepID=UPI0002F78061|nr:MarR family winged helix-turn-helix transcriptional regulator [Paenibacillus sp. OSY-SE]
MNDFNSFEKEFTSFQCKVVSHHNKFNIQGITSAQFNIIDYLDKHGPKTARELAEAFHASLPGISKLTKKLIDKNMISQTRDETDRRYYHHAVTEEGRGFLRAAATSRNEVMDSIKLTLNEEELEQFTALCQKINRSLTEAKE